jgi:hypothetical protein
MIMSNKDPLNNGGSDNRRVLFQKFCSQADGFQREDVITAAANVLMNAIRQDERSRQSAEKAFDELFGRMKAVLLDHYESGGRKKGVFPFHQTLHASLLINPNKFYS